MGHTVLVVGNGAREHALCWKLAQSPSVDRLLAAPGNPGIAAHAQCFPVLQTGVSGLVELARTETVDLVMIGPEAPLELGLADQLRAAGIATFGPSAGAARIETSKTWAKELMRAANVPTARFAFADDLVGAMVALNQFAYPLVVKADGLAAGKGVVIAHSYEEAVIAVTSLLEERVLGEAGARILIEEMLTGSEVSIFAITDGNSFRLLSPACDHKRAFEGDRGPNTGGMGAYAPTVLVDDSMLTDIATTIIEPTLRALREGGNPFVGVLYAGLMLTADGPKVIEFNARFGDPEVQVVLPLIESDLAELLYAAATGDLGSQTVSLTRGRSMVGVVLASGGYPGPYQTGTAINGVDNAAKQALVFQAGTAIGDDGALVTNGGRILTVVGSGATLAEARLHAYAGVEQIEIGGAFYRRDIGAREPVI